MRLEKSLLRVLFVILVGSVAATESLLLLQGRWREAIPLHLCSISAAAAAFLAVKSHQGILDFLWYLGMPGAVLALLFPAPASSVLQWLLNTSYYVTHALILIIPLCRMMKGMRPRKKRTPQMMLLLMGIAACAYGINLRLGTDFFFLMAPPSGTPLESVFTLGYPTYLISLFALMQLGCMGMDRLAGHIWKETAE